MSDKHEITLNLVLFSCVAIVLLAVAAMYLSPEATHEGFIKAKSVHTGKNVFGGHTDTSFSFDLWTAEGMVEVIVAEKDWHDSEVGDYVEWTGKDWRHLNEDD